MDTALRRAEREGDWRARATALRRAGRTNEARRVVCDATRHDSEAWSSLDQWFPLSAEERGLLARVVKPVRTGDPRYWQRLAAVAQLVGVGDPRFDGALAEFDDPHHGEATSDRIQACLLEADFSARLVRAVRSFGHEALARTRPTPDDIVALLDAFSLRSSQIRAAPAGWDVELGPIRALVLELAAGAGDERVAPHLRELVTDSDADPLLRYDGWEALRARGHASPGTAPRLPCGRPVRPEWVEVGVPVLELRDPLTLALHRNWAVPRFEQGDGVLQPDRWFLLLDQDESKRFNDRHGHIYGDDQLRAITRVLQVHFGDRVIRFAGDAWLVPWKGPGLAAAAEAARRAVAALPDSPPTGDCHGRLRVGVSGGIGRTIPAAEEALFEAKRAGRDRIVGP